MGSKILGVGSFFPERVVSNHEIASMVDTSDEWIESRTGISERRFSSSAESTAYLGSMAGKSAIVDSNIASSEIDLVIVATTTPDNSFPSVASRIQSELGLRAAAFDLQAVCSGFIYGLHIADALLKAKKAKTILLIGAEKMSSLLDFTDRSSCILFGDGAAAVVITKDSSSNSEIVDSLVYADGSYSGVLYSDGGVASTGNSGKLRMNGRETFKHAVQKMSDVSLEILDKNGLKVSDIDYFIPHQANLRIIDAIRDRLGMDDNKIVKTIDLHANCSAASIPLAFDALKRSGKLKRGNNILMTAFGAGFTWGAVLLKF